MRCREAQQRIENADIETQKDNALKQHLKECPECARLAAAQRKLNESFSAVRLNKESETTSFSTIKARLQSESDQLVRKEHTFMSSLINNVFNHPKISFGVGLAVIAFLFVTLVPFSYNQIVGYEVQFAKLDSGIAFNQQEYMQALGYLGYVDININFNANTASFTIDGFPTEMAARESSILFNSLTGNTTKAEITPVLKEVSGSLYAQAKDNLYTTVISVETSDMTDAEIEADITARLLAEGWDKVDVHTTTSEDGTREIQIILENE